VYWRRPRQREAYLRIVDVHLFLCPSVRLSPKCVTETLFSLKRSSLEQQSVLTTYKKSYMSLSKNPLIGPVKFMMADIRHVENREIAMSQRKKSPAFDEIWYTNAD